MLTLIVLPERLTDVLSRVRFDVRTALSPCNRPALARSVGICIRCPSDRACRQWIAGHNEGEANRLPAFCPLADYIGAHKPQRGSPNPRARRTPAASAARRRRVP